MSDTVNMAFLSRQGLFVVFLTLFLIDVTFLMREVHHSVLTSTTGISAIVVLLDVFMLKKLSQVTEQEKPSPTFSVESYRGPKP